MRKLIVIILALLLMGVTASFAAPATQVSNVEDEVFIITCDSGEEIIGGVKFTFLNINPGFSYRVSAIGIEGFDPVLAVITAPGEGRCNDDTPRLAGSQVAVPGLGLIEADGLSAQVQVNTPRAGNVDVVVGGFGGSNGRFAMVIEGLAIFPRDELDGFLISVPEAVQNEQLGVFMVSRDGSSLDPYMELYGGQGFQQDPISFDDAFLIGACDDVASTACTTEPFPGGGVLITNGFRYEASDRDAGLIYTPESNDPHLFVFGSFNGASTGDYAIIVVGHVPGDLIPDEPTTGSGSSGFTSAGTGTGSSGPASANPPTAAQCRNVAVDILEVSSVFNESYGAERLLDVDSSTAWSSDSNSQQTITIELDGRQNISGIYFNSHSVSQGFETDSVREFTVTANGRIVLAAEAALTRGYQPYTFAPVTTNAITLTLLSNYGGDYFEAADILVCAE